MSHLLLLELYSKVWAMRPEALADGIALVNREDVTPEMLASSFHFSEEAQAEAIVGGTNRYAVHQRTSTRVDGTSGLYRRGTTAILPITGPIFRRGGMTMSSGPVTSVEMLARDFTRALEDDAFASILLDVDTPGGEASGIDEFARMIFEGRQAKPIWAYVSDLGASAGYWLATAAEQVVIAPAAAIGSIGCVMAVRDPNAVKQTAIEFVSRQSPNKRPNPTTDEGKAELQGLVDALGDLFVSAVATQRGVKTETVESEFGAGGLKVGQAAVDARMADRLGSLEGTLRELAELTKPQSLRKAAAALPVAEPVAADAGERAPTADVVAAESSPAVDLGSPQEPMATAPLRGEGDIVNLYEELKAMVERAASATPVASGDQSAAIVASNLTPPAQAQAQPVLQPAAQVSISEQEELRLLRQRAVAAESENSRLRLNMIKARAEAFVQTAQNDLKAFAPEAPHLIGLYMILASDDEVHGPVDLGGGKNTSRVQALEMFIATRPSRKQLTDDVLGGTVAHVLGERARPKGDPNAAPGPERLAELLGETPAGRDVLDALSRAKSPQLA